MWMVDMQKKRCVFRPQGIGWIAISIVQFLVLAFNHSPLYQASVAIVAAVWLIGAVLTTSILRRLYRFSGLEFLVVAVVVYALYFVMTPSVHVHAIRSSVPEPSVDATQK